MIANGPYYITNNQIHRDLNIASITKEIKKYVVAYKTRITGHSNPLIADLTSHRVILKLLPKRFN